MGRPSSGGTLAHLILTPDSVKRLSLASYALKLTSELSQRSWCHFSNMFLLCFVCLIKQAILKNVLWKKKKEKYFPPYFLIFYRKEKNCCRPEVKSCTL